MVRCSARIGVVRVLTIWLLPEVLNVEPTAVHEETNTGPEERPTSVEDRQDRTRSSPSRRHTTHFQNESQVSRTRHLDRF